MGSRQGRIASQLTQWVGGTIIILMFIFVLADFAIERHYLIEYQNEVASRGAEGLRTLLDGRSYEESKANLEAGVNVDEYTESKFRGFVLFDAAGNPLFKTSGLLPNDPGEIAKLSKAPGAGRVEIRRVKSGEGALVAAVTSFTSKDDPPISGVAAYVINVSPQQQMALETWGLRSCIVLVMIIGTMLAVRIPVKRFVVAPIDGLFMAAYAASKDDFQKLPPCPVDNEFAELYAMFNRMMNHLSDTRVPEGLAGGESPIEDGPEQPGE